MKPTETHRRSENISEGRGGQTPESFVAIRGNLFQRLLLQAKVRKRSKFDF
jgi:hypothetical protein